MAKRKKEKRIYRYSCTISGESYKLTKKIDNTDELVSVNSYYELNPEEDDRPAIVKKELGIETEEQEA